MTPANFVVWNEPPTFFSNSKQEQIDKLVREEVREPLGQELFREAWFGKRSSFTDKV